MTYKLMKISSMHDLQIAKERYTYEVKLYEQAFSGSCQNMGRTAMNSFKNSLYQFGQTLAIALVRQTIKAKRRSK